MIDPKNYYVVQGWMISELELKGNELLVYAIIYGFSQNDNLFNASIQYLADWTNTTRRSTINTLNSLVQKGLLIKSEECNTTHTYKAIIPGENTSLQLVKKVHSTSENISPQLVKKVHSTSENISPNNKYIIYTYYNNKLTHEIIRETDSQYTLPTKGEEVVVIDSTYINLLQTTFPDKDVSGELLKMKAWLISNPSRAKTVKGTTKFINTWLSNAKPMDKPLRSFNLDDYKIEDDFF